MTPGDFELRTSIYFRSRDRLCLCLCARFYVMFVYLCGHFDISVFHAWPWLFCDELSTFTLLTFDGINDWWHRETHTRDRRVCVCGWVYARIFWVFLIFICVCECFFRVRLCVYIWVSCFCVCANSCWHEFIFAGFFFWMLCEFVCSCIFVLCVWMCKRALGALPSLPWLHFSTEDYPPPPPPLKKKTPG